MVNAWDAPFGGITSFTAELIACLPMFLIILMVKKAITIELMNQSFIFKTCNPTHVFIEGKEGIYPGVDGWRGYFYSSDNHNNGETRVEEK
ncbi:hypothetical protein MJO29_003799 [Puccinia striiformis f. sp. tritici]|nr:hypothetical protein MJO29_003799 [Puccinia striiformis f. sp. tritici]